MSSLDELTGEPFLQTDEQIGQYWFLRGRVDQSSNDRTDIMPRIDRGAHGRNRYDQCMYEPTYATRPACENVVIDVDDIARLEIVRCSNFRCLMFNISGVCSAAVYIRVYRQHTGSIQARQLTYSRAYCELRSESSACDCDCDCEAARASDE